MGISYFHEPHNHTARQKIWTALNTISSFPLIKSTLLNTDTTQNFPPANPIRCQQSNICRSNTPRPESSSRHAGRCKTHQMSIAKSLIAQKKEVGRRRIPTDGMETRRSHSSSRIQVWTTTTSHQAGGECTMSKISIRQKEHLP
jgi:hypothetical protein